MPKSCVKQVQSKRRSTSCTSADARQKEQQINNEVEVKDKVTSFTSFVCEVKKRYPLFSFSRNGQDFTMYRTDRIGQKVVFIHFRKVKSKFGVLKYVTAEHNEMEVLKQTLGVPRNRLLQKWSMVCEIVDKGMMYKPSNEDYLQKALESIQYMENLLDTTTFQFLIEQFQLLISKKHASEFSLYHRQHIAWLRDPKLLFYWRKERFTTYILSKSL